MNQLYKYLPITLFFLFQACNMPAKDNSSMKTELNDSIKLFFNQNQLLTKLNTAEDSLIFESIIKKFAKRHSSIETGDLLLAIGREFMNTPYVASTLEAEGGERLVINLREMDCTTFVEYVVAIGLCLKNDLTSFHDFAQFLAVIRYRNGIIDGYPSRLHYFSDWLHDNAQKDLLGIVSNEFGNAPFDTRVSFMSTHPQSYRQLSNQEFLKEITEIEKNVSSRKMLYLTKEQINAYASYIHNGDIIAFTTTIEGLDVSHTAFAMHIDGKLHFLHASLVGKKVEISAEPLQDYLARQRRVDGILVGRIK